MRSAPRFRWFPIQAVALAALLVVLIATFGAPTTLRARQAEDQRQQGQGPEANLTAKGFLDFVNQSNEKTLRAHAGLSSEVVDKILARRAGGKSFASLSEFRHETGIRSVDFQTALRPFYERDQRANSLQASRKPIPDPATPPASDPRAEKLRSKESVPPAPPAPTSSAATEGPIANVRPGYYGDLEGYENWEGIDPIVKKEFFETINREFCSCGCSKETLAFCYVNDPGCPVVRARVRKIYDDLVRQNREAPAGAESAPPN